MRIVGWNIRAGGGRRIDRVAAHLARWQADIAVLSEFRGTPASTWLATDLADRGLSCQLTSVSATFSARNGLLVASRWPLERIQTLAHPQPRERCLPVRIAAPEPFGIVAVHGPLGASGLRRPFNDRLLSIVERWRGAPGMVVGDTNTGKRGIDE